MTVQKAGQCPAFWFLEVGSSVGVPACDFGKRPCLRILLALLLFLRRRQGRLRY
ncbi:MAG: hypothetical protein HN356_00730 [Calditrichaeota bacterium]|nr:hypothetical protein [Calditrichota bacterium]MBT7619330.1 hypothetical protein [Calditrichota bacterium]